jgi:hypothetical protein
MTNKRLLRGTELRFALTIYLFQHGPTTVADLIDALDYQGFDIPGRASKSVSDALRWEMVHGRVCRIPLRRSDLVIHRGHHRVEPVDRGVAQPANLVTGGLDVVCRAQQIGPNVDAQALAGRSHALTQSIVNVESDVWQQPYPDRKITW